MVLPSEKRPRISTKFNIDTSAGDFAGQIERSVAASLQRLGLASVPLLILHSRVVDACNKERDNRSLSVAGGAGTGRHRRHHGQTCACRAFATGSASPDWETRAPLHQVIDSGRFDAVQIYYNLLNPTAMASAGPGWSSTDFDGLLHRCAAQDMGVMGIRIFAAGHLASSERHGREVAITANAEDAAEEARAKAALDALGSQHGTGAQAALRFGLACPLLSTIVVGIGETWHLDEALAAAEMGPLPASAIQALERLWHTDPAFRRAPA